MSALAFDRLAPFIKEFVYRNRWEELRPVQTAACDVIFNSDAHLLLASGTASGKTEAAFLPVLTLLHERPSSSIGALYIGPLKALINDQFERLDALLEEAEIPVCPWHGDVADSKKRKFLREPRGILQITPESMEGMFMYRSNRLGQIFGDLRFVIIDEVHAFMGSERGRQVLCHLERLRPYTSCEPRRIGLSATLGDYSVAAEWLGSGSSLPVVRPELQDPPRQIRLAVEHYFLPDSDEEEEEEAEEQDCNTALDQAQASTVAEGIQERGVSVDVDPATLRDIYCQYLWRETSGRAKVLLFTNSRPSVEATVAELRTIAERNRQPDVYHVHHGSISRELRESAEQAMRDPNQRGVTAATVTMELGIDIGLLDRVIQLGKLSSVSSFVQRLGRSGRRGQPAEMCVCITEQNRATPAAWPELIPWGLLQTIAVMQLYLEERWIEPQLPRKKPCSLLYHQTLATLASQGEMSPAVLAQRVLSLSVFRHFTQEEYRQLLRHLLEIEHLEQTPEGGLIVGLAAERIVNSYEFLAVFQDTSAYTVKEGSREIGSLEAPVPEGQRFRLAGRTWLVVQLDIDRKTIYVKRIRGRSTVYWLGGDWEIHTRILQRMRRVLVEDQQFSYLQPHARERLQGARLLAQQVGIGVHDLLPLSDRQFCLLPWLGTKAFETLRRWISRGTDSLEKACAHLAPGNSGYYMVLNCPNGNAARLLQLIKEGMSRSLDPQQLIDPKEKLLNDKFDLFIPKTLLQSAFALDELDPEDMKKGIDLLL